MGIFTPNLTTDLPSRLLSAPPASAHPASANSKRPAFSGFNPHLLGPRCLWEALRLSCPFLVHHNFIELHLWFNYWIPLANTKTWSSTNGFRNPPAKRCKAICKTWRLGLEFEMLCGLNSLIFCGNWGLKSLFTIRLDYLLEAT